MCHLALLLPVVGLAVFFVLPLPVALVIYLVILGASVLLYKAVIDAMCRRVVTGREAMLGAHDHEIDHECHGQREDEEHRQADNRQKKGEMAHLGGAPAFDPDVLTLDRKLERGQGPGWGSG